MKHYKITHTEYDGEREHISDAVYQAEDEQGALAQWYKDVQNLDEDEETEESPVFTIEGGRVKFNGVDTVDILGLRTMIRKVSIKETKFTDEKLLSYNAAELFGDDNINWRYCVANATFSHKEACEFVLHIGSDVDEPHWVSEVERMQSFGCTQDFIDVYTEAMQEGAIRLLLFV